ncbi:MAG: hypothetical protein BAJALOKI3v1_640019 [Promethearchaeota archaeon]|jgi:predicted SprT family Zn-dependent metalloprotease|nr:MAG: hypothetical protein BAJALOKI3v1_640019 [Candidatus Lokiarchaeota archaeon]
MSSENSTPEFVRCDVKNCQKKIRKDNAIKVGEHYFCKVCGVAYIREQLNI